MRRSSRVRACAVALALAVGVAGAGALSQRQAHGSGAFVPMTSVSSATLAANGVELLVPSSGAAVSADQAAAVALRYYAGATVRERVLARVQDEHVHPALDRLCWVLSIVPRGGIFSASGGGHGVQLPGTFRLFIVDAESGAPLLGIAGGTVR